MNGPWRRLPIRAAQQHAEIFDYVGREYSV